MTPFTIPQLLLRAAERSPERIALSDPKHRWSYGELVGHADRYATALAEAGVVPGDRVGLCLEKSNEAVAALYGILLRGAAYVPLDPQIPAARAGLICQNVDLRVVVTTPEQLVMLQEIPRLEAAVLSRGRVGEADGQAQADRLRLVHATSVAGRAADRREFNENYLAYVLHTSGSTGKPKGVAITHRNALSFVEPAADYFALDAADVLACQAPLHFDLSVFDLFCAALTGAEVVLFPEYFSAFPKKMTQAIRERKITVLNCVVSALSLLLEKGKLSETDGVSLRSVIFSGERMPLPLLRRLSAALPKAHFFNVYGQTEANSSLVYPIDTISADDAEPLPLGDPLPNFEITVIDAEGRPAESGELVVCAPTVASGGYFGDPERSRDKFVVDPRYPDSAMRAYRTGDLVKRNGRGELIFVGRADDMVKSRGYRVELGEIESALSSVAGVVEFAVAAVPDPLISNRLLAFVVVASGLDAEAVTRALSGLLPAYMVPEVLVRSELFRTSTGKIDKRALVEGAA